MRSASLFGTVFSIAVGFALEVSGIGGQAASIAAWSVVLLLIAWGVLLRVRSGERDSCVDPLRPALELGRDMLGFVRLRGSTAPSPPEAPRGFLGLLPTAKAQADESASADYDAETMFLWVGKFAKRLSAVLADLHRLDHIGHNEARKLIAPASPDEVEVLAERLIELGCQGV